MTLVLHAGADPIDLDGLRAIPTPEPTATHFPLAHFDLVNMVIYALEYFGHTVEKSEFGVTPDGMKMYGQLTLKSDYGDYTDLVGLANSNNRTIPVSLGFGSNCFICDNSAFVAETVVRRKHTANSKRQLPGIIAEIIEPLKLQRQAQFQQFEAYKHTPLTDERADHLIMEMWRRGIINTTRIAEVFDQWEKPTVDYGPKTVYRLFNGATWSLKPKVMEQPRLTADLHQLMDSIVEYDPNQLLLLPA